MKIILKEFKSKKGNKYTLYKRGGDDFVIIKTNPSGLYTVFATYNNLKDATVRFTVLKRKHSNTEKLVSVMSRQEEMLDTNYTQYLSSIRDQKNPKVEKEEQKPESEVENSNAEKKINPTGLSTSRPDQ